ncbi:BZ3500_MvSof-1268-A1-R1_Chr9g10647 [Microbotryum saponariae]|uniref:BZ3500_MvSof-1268-A1-R1_Chr9g10647 protein n=1 Tax=Microbotryum saponariae TaxID=289078 RepID=A0A2X0L7D5_9BASI|nr:BZ3501_MvSof-1269-A2-R1_Chr9g10395 [Microbotryum saponariae]SDA00448.1 BZ3500_MvSof-1268-A1-R1_Chr9g10647 [Microbotryum saponariae]
MASYGKKRGRASRVAPDSEREEDGDEPQPDKDDQNEHEEEPRPSKGKGKDKTKAVATEKGKGSGKGKARQASDDEEEDEEVFDDEGADEDDDETTGRKKKGKGALSTQEKEDLVKAITRHILFSEYTRKLHSRADIVKTGECMRDSTWQSKTLLIADSPFPVLPDGQGRYFNELIPKVQKNLRKVLGMELVALRPKENSTAKNPAKVYALRSTLPIQLIRASAARPLASISSSVDDDLAESSALARELINYAEDDDDGDLSGLHTKQRAEAKGGYIRDVKREEGAAYGILGVILALILVNGKVLGDGQSLLRRKPELSPRSDPVDSRLQTTDQLITYLRRLSLYPSTIIPLSPCSSHPGHLNLDHFIQLMCKQGYLERSASGAAPAAAAAAAARTGHVPATQRTVRGKGADLIEGGDAAIEYRWGARAEVEIGEVGVAQFIQTIFEAGGPKKSLGGDDDEEEEGEEGATERRKETPEEKKRKAERLMIELKRAAGTVSLQDAAEVEVTL